VKASSDPTVLRREAAECRRLLVDDVQNEGVKRLLQEHAYRTERLAEQFEMAGNKGQRKREIDAAYRADVARWRA